MNVVVMAVTAAVAKHPIPCHRLQSRLILAAAVAAVYCGLAAPVQAASFQQFANDLNYGIDSLMDSVLPPGVNDVRLGGGVAAQPKYEGDDQMRVSAVPVISARYSDWAFLEGTSARFNMFAVGKATPKKFRAGPMMKLDFGRDESNSRDLRGLGNVSTSVELGGYMSYNIGAGRIRASIRQDVASGHKGAVADFDAGMLVYHTPRFRAAVQAGVTWSSSKYNKSFFGVAPAQALGSGLPLYSPGSGFKSFSVSVGGEYQIIQQWSVGIRADYKRLFNEAANSPLVRQRGSRNQFGIGSAVIYSF